MSRITILTGHYGSGKTEIALNLALSESLRHEKTALNDLDVVNPYFRSRDAEKLLQLHKIELISPKGKLAKADLPIVSSEIYGILHDPRYRIIIDAGGDIDGAVVLGQYYHEWKRYDPELLFVLNNNRPNVNTLTGALSAAVRIEEASRLKVTGIINNANLGNETSMENIFSGFEASSLLSEKMQIPLKYTCISVHLRGAAQEFAKSHDVRFIERYMKLPWEG